MKIILGYVDTPQGHAALEAAIAEANLRKAELVVVHSEHGGERQHDERIYAAEDAMKKVHERLKNEDLEHTEHHFIRGQSPSEDLVQAAHDFGADLIVIGLRRRSATGKYLLGSNAQEILMDAPCPVLCVKAETG